MAIYNPDGKDAGAAVREQGKAELRDEIRKKLRDRGCRITRQRETILGIVLSGECTSCKEIYQDAVKIDPSIGFATVYRMVNLLEDMGLISSRNRFLVAGEKKMQEGGTCTLLLSDNTTRTLQWDTWTKVISEGLRAEGIASDQTVEAVFLPEVNV